MPIYAYRCADCGHTKDVLQKLSDAPLRECPACGAAAFSKQVTAAGFQLKGSGWYVTDFRGGSSAAKDKSESADKGTDSAAGKPAEAPAGSADKAPAPAPAPSATETKASAAPAPKAASGPPAAGKPTT